jgi:L-seryl-tRNA selenium transferase/Selenocysteine synthase N terminal
MTSTVALRKLPAVDLVLRTEIAAEATKRFGRQAVVAAVRKVLAEARAARESLEDPNLFAGSAVAHLNEQAKSKLLSVFNLTGTVLHTNLGRAILAEAAIDAATSAMRNAVALEFDLGGGNRGDRDDVVRDCNDRQQQRRGDPSSAEYDSQQARGDRVARRTDRNRRRLPHAGNHEPCRREIGRGRNH